MNTRKFECTICRKTLISKYSLQRHVKTKHNDVHKCAICSKTLASEQALLKHTEIKHDVNNFFECAMCNKIFSRKWYLQKHIQVTHSLNCAICGEQFPDRLKYLKHVRTEHQQSFECANCGEITSRRDNFIRHWNNKHENLPAFDKPPKSKNSANSYLKCLICAANFPSKRIINYHYEDDHKINLTIENLSFSSIVEFYDWKRNVQQETITQFRKRDQHKANNQTVIRYICHRTGLCPNTLNIDMRKRSLKTNGYKKIDGFCPAEIILNHFNDGACVVRYLKTHIGHDTGNECEVKHIYLDAEEKMHIAMKIQEGIPVSHIMKQYVSSKMPDKNGTRLSLLCKKDVYNIISSYNLKFDGPSKIETSANELTTEAMISEHRNDILYYKKHFEEDDVFHIFRPDDFVLIIMDKEQEKNLLRYGHKLVTMNGTFGMNPYRFFLHTLLVTDIDCEGIPVAFAVSNRNDGPLIEVFLRCIRNRIGIVNSTSFISDIQCTYYNSWVEIMNEPNYHLFSTWHIKAAWQKKLANIRNTSKRKEIRRQLYDLWEELNPVIFENKLETFLSNNDEETKIFIDYFRDNFAHLSQQWAYCFRSVVGINSNIHLELFHRILKREIANSQNVKTLAQYIQFLFDYKTFKDHQIRRKEIIGAITNKLSLLRMRHREVIKFVHLNEKKLIDMVIQIDDGIFLVQSFEGYHYYTVSQVIPKECSIYADDMTCRLLCASCKTCFHQYRCSCRDHSISNNMCKHIHALALTINSNSNNVSSNTSNDVSINISSINDINKSIDIEMTDDCTNANSSYNKSHNNKLIASAVKNVLGKLEQILLSANSADDVHQIDEMYTRQIETTMKILKDKL